MVPQVPLKQVGLGHTHWLDAQFSPVPQLPHETVRDEPQRSVRVMDPHSAPAAEHSSASVSGLHTQELPEHCCVVLLQVFGQLLELPQAFETLPHATPEQDGVGHTHMPLLQFSPAPQEPQELIEREVPQLSVAVRLPHALLLALHSEVLD